MKIRLDQRSIDTAAGARSIFAPAKISTCPAVFSRTQLVLYVTLLLMLFASGFVPRARAQNIYVGGLNSSDFTATIAKYAPDGSALDEHFITELRSYVQSMSIYQNALVVPNDDVNSEVLDYDIAVGKPLNFNVPVPYPASAVVGGSHTFVLYDYPARLADYRYSTGAFEYDLATGLVSAGTVMAGWTDSAGNTDLYITIFADATGLPRTGSILHVRVNSDGTQNGTPGTIATGLTYPTGIAVSADGQYVYVVDFKAVIQDDVGYLSRYKTSGGPALYRVELPTQSPYGVAISGAAVFVTGYGNYTVGEYYAATGATINNALVQGVSLPTAIAIGPPVCVHPPTGLVAWYSFDKAGTFQDDLSLGLNTATAHNTTGIPGEVSGALQFNGTNAYVEAPDAAQINLDKDDFTIDAWVKIASEADYRGVVTILDKRDRFRGYSLFLYNGRLGVQLAGGASFNNYITPVDVKVPADSRWHLVAVTVGRHRPDGGLWFIDGAPVGRFDASKYQNSDLDNLSSLRIGSRTSSQGGGGRFKGGIDEVEIFGRELGTDEILGIMQAGPAGKCKCTAPPSNMIAWYSFDQAGSVQNDLSTGNNPATAFETVSIIGEVDGALQFDGTYSYVEAPPTSGLNLGMSDFSIDAWVRIHNTDDDRGVVVVMDKRDGAQGYSMYLYNGAIGVQLADSNGYDNYTAPVAVPADNQWHLIAATVVRNSHTGGTWYLDGLSVGNFDPTAHQSSLDNSSPLDIGVRSAAQGGGGYFNGGIDELEIFNRALSSTEMKTLKLAGHAGKCKGY